MRRLLLATGVLLAGAVPAHAATTTVEAADNVFRPKTATVSVGDTVTWKNTGQAPHEVTASAFKSGNIDPGKSWSWTATKAGTYSYVCQYHESAGMTGTLVVRAAGATSGQGTATGHPKTGSAALPLGLLVLGVAAVAGASLRYGWRVR
jgi:plastocyanin